MGYSLTGLLLDADAAKAPRTLEGILLNQGVTLIPLTDEIIDSMPNQAAQAAPFGRDWRLNAALEKLIVHLSKFGKVAYVDIDYFGGVGTQDAAIWENEKLIFGPVHTAGHGAVNQALRRFGVVKGNAIDEFDAVDLSRFRHTADWLDGEP